MKSKTVFYCTDCGNESAKWQGRCGACGSWNTLVEQTLEPKSKTKTTASQSIRAARSTPKTLAELGTTEELRFTTGLLELDRVLGGGAVTGSLVLVGGAPGVGKSTLLLQICGVLSSFARILYVSGEESERQIKLRAERLGVQAGVVYVLAETDIDEMLAVSDELKPDILIADSVQTLYTSELTSLPGSVGQLKECTMRLLRYAKDAGVTVFLIGHVNKEGAIAGPKVLEHMVDCVLYFEGEQSMNYRILRAVKNRYGSTNEIGIFEMCDTGLSEIANPSELLLAGRPKMTPGTCVTCVIEGTRPVLAEIQALIAPGSYNVPRRNANGVDYNRAMMLLAVLEKRAGLKISGSDAYINVIGGLNINDTGADLAAMLAIASSYRDKPVAAEIAAIGEAGLTGEIRSVLQLNLRLKEAVRLGFKKCLVPHNSKSKLTIPQGIEIIAVKTITEALNVVLG